MTTIATTSTSAKSSLLLFIAYRRGADDGDAAAQWLNERLRGRQVALDNHRTAVVKTYYDQRAPAIHDWTQKWKGDLRTARAMIFVASPGTAARRHGTDWLYDEIAWWTRNRRIAPMLLLAGEDNPSWIPEPLARKWPKAQRLIWSPVATEAENDILVERLLEGLALSERGITYEDLRRLQIRNRGLVALSVIALMLAVLAALFARSQREQRQLAERNLQLTYGPSLQVALSAYTQGDVTMAKQVLLGISPQLRGVEWNLVRSLFDQSRQTRTEANEVTDLDYSPDGRWLAVGQAGGKVMLHSIKPPFERDFERQVDGGRVTSQRPVTAADGQQGVLTISSQPRVNAVRFFGPTEFATAGEDGRVHLWYFSGGRSTRTLEPEGTPARRTLAVSPDGNWLASGTEDGLVHVWRVDRDPLGGDSDPRATLKVAWEPESLVFTADGKHLIVAGQSLYAQSDYSPFLVAWDWQPGGKAVPLETAVQVSSVAILGADLYGGRDDGSVVTWDVATAKMRVVLAADAGRGSIRSLQASPDKQHLGFSVTNRVNLWDRTDGTLRTFTGAEKDVSSFRFAPPAAGEILASASGKSVKFYDLDRQATRTDLPTTEARLFDASADGQIVVTTSGTNPTGSITIWDRHTGKHTDLAVPSESYSVKVFPDGGRFVVGWRDGTIRCYRATDGQVLWTRKAVDRVDTLVLSPRVDLLVSGSEGVTKVSYEIWRTDSGERVGTVAGSGTVALSADGAHLVTPGYSSFHRDGEPDTPLFRISDFPNVRSSVDGPSRREPVSFLTFDPSGRRLLVVSKAVEVWDVSGSPKQERSISVNDRLPTCAGFSPDGSRFFACEFDGNGDPRDWRTDLMIWSTETGDLLLRLWGDSRNNYSAAKWIKDAIYFQNQGTVSIMNVRIDDLEDWEETARWQERLAQVEALAAESRRNAASR
jgi:WD40 repeat protein